MGLFGTDKTVFEKRLEGLVVQVIDRGDKRMLMFGNQIVQSAIFKNSPGGLVLDYTQAMVTGLLFPRRLHSFLHLGLGGGSLASFFHHHLPGIRQRVVELSPEVVQVAREYFHLPDSSRLEVIQGDGAQYLRMDTARYDLVFLDAFNAEGADSGLNNAEVYRLIREHILPDGWLVLNVWGSDKANMFKVQQELIGIFPQIYKLPVRVESNVIFMAGAGDRKASTSFMRRRARYLNRSMNINLEKQLGNMIPIRVR
ncbi:MAG: fused MFS/spermidine synthase [Deltaproteobacteria bacterium]|nr:fused MFS/spermidine synthase [Deltaproteobacteria bacterium]